MNTNISTSDTLDLAADHIQFRGWTKGGGGWNGTGSTTAPLCLEGGIMAATGLRVGKRYAAIDKVQQCPAYRAVQSFLDMRQDEELYWYNDTIAKSADEVIAVLRACAAVERAKEAVYADDDQPLPVEVAA